MTDPAAGAYADLPVKMGEIEVGRIRAGEDGTLVIHVGARREEIVREIFQMARMGVIAGLKVTPIVYPAVDGRLMSRLANERPLLDFGGIRIDDHTHPHMD